MGIARESFYLLSNLQKKFNFNDASVIQLGRQSGIVSKRQINSICQNLGTKFNFEEKNSFDFYRNFPTGDEIFRGLGFSDVDSLDLSNFEGATIEHNLNLPLPSSFTKQYDLVFDGGTTEHIFDQINALKNIHKLLKIGGLIVHYTPANNFLDHGYFQQQPSFYYEYYLENGYEIIDSYLIESYYDFFRKRKVYAYKPLIYEHMSYGGWRNKLMGNWFVFKKTNLSTSGLIPNQQRYINYFHTSVKPESSSNKVYVYIVKFFNDRPKLKFITLQTKHWSLKIAKTSNYLGISKSPKPLFRA